MHKAIAAFSTDIAKAGFKTVRIPICFSAWMQLKRPYDWDNPKGLEIADLFVRWALANNLNVIIDLHHTEFDGKNPDAANPERLVNLWLRIAERFKNTDPEKVFFELRNEPHDMPAETWRWQSEQMIKIVRETAPSHTLIVGFHDWNGRQAMIDSQPFADKNLIYTFHYYHPFLFTHQGSTWSGAEGIEEINARSPADDEALSSDDGVSFETSANGTERGVDDPRVLETIGRALRVVESGGTIAIRVEANGGQRTTRIRLTRNT